MYWNKLKPGHKVICINNIYDFVLFGCTASLTIGKLYEVIELDSVDIKIRNDCNALRLHSVYWFKVPYELYCENIGII